MMNKSFELLLHVIFAAFILITVYDAITSTVMLTPNEAYAKSICFTMMMFGIHSFIQHTNNKN